MHFSFARLALDLFLDALRYSFPITEEATEQYLFIIGGEGSIQFPGVSVVFLIEHNRDQIFKGTFRESQMLAKVHIVIPIEKQITSALRNRFPCFYRTSQTQDMEKTFGPISLLIPDYFYVRCWQTKLQIFVIVRRLVVGEY